MNVKQEIKLIYERLAVLEQQLLDEPSYDWDNAPVITTIDGIKYILGPEADKVMTWDDAINWCKFVGGELPPREVLLMCDLNTDRGTVFVFGNYWSSTTFDGARSWYHNFNIGSQDYATNLARYFVRAVKSFPL